MILVMILCLTTLDFCLYSDENKSDLQLIITTIFIHYLPLFLILMKYKKYSSNIKCKKPYSIGSILALRKSFFNSFVLCICDVSWPVTTVCLSVCLSVRPLDVNHWYSDRLLYCGLLKCIVCYAEVLDKNKRTESKVIDFLLTVENIMGIFIQ